MNDKCAAGTGRFLEVLANILGVRLDEMSELAFNSKSKVPITSTCTVFAESEVISLIVAGHRVKDIVAGLSEAITERISGLVRKVGVRDDVVMTGGVAKNRSVIRALEDVLGCEGKGT